MRCWLWLVIKMDIQGCVEKIDGSVRPFPVELHLRRISACNTGSNECRTAYCATAVGGTPELVQEGETGVLVNAGATTTLCATLKGLMASSVGTHQDLKQRINLILKRFSFPKMVAKTEEVFAGVVRR
jgi:hypothetical protein